MWNNFEDFCKYMYQENITERKGFGDFSDVTYEEYKKNNFDYLFWQYRQQMVQAV
jgi:hypothetical protein